MQPNPPVSNHETNLKTLPDVATLAAKVDEMANKIQALELQNQVLRKALSAQHFAFRYANSEKQKSQFHQIFHMLAQPDLIQAQGQEMNQQLIALLNMLDKDSQIIRERQLAAKK